MSGQSGQVYSRRDFCKVIGTGLASPAVYGAARVRASEGPSEQGDLILKSNRFLSIGINRKTGRAFVEEKSSGEVWVWNWKDVRATNSKDFAGERAWFEVENASQELKPITPETILPLPDGFELRYSADWGKFSCTVQLPATSPDVIFKVQPELRYRCDLTAIQFPSTLRPETQPRPTLLDTVDGGRLHRPAARAENFSPSAETCWMRYYGVLGTKSAYLAILEPRFDAALLYSNDGRGPLSFGWVQMPRWGRIDQIRTQQIRFVPAASYVDLARAFRAYAKQQGFYRSLEDKLEECPSLSKMFGAVLIMLGYLHDTEADYSGTFRKLKQRGVEKAYVYPVNYFNLNGTDELYPGYKWIHLGRGILDELDRLGYLYAPWVWLNEILGTSPYFQDSLTIHHADGSKSLGWKIGELQWYNSHEGRVLEILKEAAPELRAKYTAAHFDVLNAGPCLENYGSWPYDRKMDSEYRDGMFAQFSLHDRVVGSEQNKDWAVPYKHFGTNKLPGPYGTDAPFWPVPLWQLSFHDAVMTTWWEHSTYNDPELGHDFSGREIRRRSLLDTLTGDLPSVCPVGRMYGWVKPGDPDRKIFVYRYNFDDPVTLKAVDAAVEVARFNARHATDDLVSHEFLSEDGQRQQTSYASGTKVRIRVPETSDPSDQGELEVS
ncbi:MAG: hypothetical protein ABSF46_00350 [Terriglobia bacterium]